MSYDPHCIPEWALEIIAKRKLHERADDITGGVIVLLEDAGSALRTAALLMFEDQAAEAGAVRTAEDASTMARDAIALARISPNAPQAGIVERKSNGDLLWRPIAKDDEHGG